jgi:ketosteroid isomerase-like protein
MASDDAAHEAVRQIHEAWLAAELSGDIEGVLTLCTSDVRWLAPDTEMVVGREAGRRLLTTQVELENIVASDVHVEISGDLAFKTSRYETHYRLPGQRGLHVARGTHIWILRRQGAEWCVELVTWQVSKPPDVSR